MFEPTMYPFIEMFPQQGQRECRVAYIWDNAQLPDDEYAFIELYCTDPTCDCQRVVINVMAVSSWKHLATINYGFGKDDDMAGPFLDPLNRQSKYSVLLMDLFKSFLSDAAYTARLKRHYQQVKEALKDANHPIHARIAGKQKNRQSRSANKSTR